MGLVLRGAILLCFLLAMGVGPAWADAPTLERQPVDLSLGEWEEERRIDCGVYWKSGGPVFTSLDGRFAMGIHGRIMADFTFFGDADTELEEAIGDTFKSGFQFRRAWLAFTGKATDYVAWVVQLAFEHDDLVPFLEIWLQIRNLQDCLGCLAPDIKIGHTLEPIGLAWLTSSKHFQLTAWPLPTTTFTPGLNTGLILHSTAWGKRATAQLGYFLASSDVAGGGRYRDGHALTGRITCLPWADCESDCRFLHLGAGASYRFDLSSVRFRSRPDIDLGPFVVDTDRFAAHEELFVDVETALVLGAFSVQAEGMWVHVDAASGHDPDFWGWYVQASYLLGAECRSYNRACGVFTGVKPGRAFDCRECGWGGWWELVLRVDGVDLDDGDKRGGRCKDIVFGVNYAFNANARIMLNLVHADVRGAHGGRRSSPGDGTIDAAVVRLQVNW